MKVLDIPKSGKLGLTVFFPSRFGLCARAYTVPNPRSTPARNHMHGVFGGNVADVERNAKRGSARALERGGV